MNRDSTGDNWVRPAYSKRRRLLHIAIIATCACLSTFLTWIEPISVIEFSRAGSILNGKVTSLMLFVIPYRQTVIQNVTNISDEFRIRDLQLRQETRFGTQVTHAKPGSAFLRITSAQGGVTVPVSSANIENVLQQAKRFQTASVTPKLRLVIVSNWKVTLSAGLLILCGCSYFSYLVWSWRMEPRRRV